MSRASRRRGAPIDGVLLLDKPVGGSSNAALQTARRLIGAAKAGHAGTLDPMASGLLPVLFGEATKFSQILLDADKAYETTLKLGVTTTTGDVEGELVERLEVSCSEAQIHAACAAMVGEIEQLPPMYSALKHQGKALYEYARQGVEIERKTRLIHIRSIEVLSVVGDEVGLRVCCSKGTYIRTLGEDIGRALGCGAHLIALRRIGAGPLKIEDAVSLETLDGMSETHRADVLLEADTLVAHFPALLLNASQAERVQLGQAVEVLDYDGGDGACRLYGAKFLGLGCVEGTQVKPTRLIAQQQD